MPRLSRTVVAERETFTNTNFAAGMSLEQAQEALVAKDGHKMAPKRLKELFDAAEKPEAASVTHPPCETPNCDGKGNACVDAPKEPPKATFPDKPVVRELVTQRVDLASFHRAERPPSKPPAEPHKKARVEEPVE